MVAVALPNMTPVAPVKLVPVIVIVASLTPGVALVGVKLVMVGWPLLIRNASVLVPEAVPVPSVVAVVTVTAPVLVPAGTTAVIEALWLTLGMAVPPPVKATEVAPVKLVPVNVIVVPAAPLFGEKAVIVGMGGLTVKDFSPRRMKPLPPVPFGVVTVIVPFCGAGGHHGRERRL